MGGAGWRVWRVVPGVTWVAGGECSTKQGGGAMAPTAVGTSRECGALGDEASLTGAAAATLGLRGGARNPTPPRCPFRGLCMFTSPSGARRRMTAMASLLRAHTPRLSASVTSASSCSCCRCASATCAGGACMTDIVQHVGAPAGGQQRAAVEGWQPLIDGPWWRQRRQR